MNYSESMLYVVNEDINVRGNIGVKKKINAQIRVFKKHFPKCLMTYYAYGMAYLLEDDRVIEKEVALSRAECFQWYCTWMKKYHCRWVYMRCMIPATYIYISFLRKMKEIGVRIVLEYPSYPYEGEVKSEEILREDREYRNCIGEYVSLATTYAKGETVHGIRTVALQNGVDLQENPVRNMRKRGKDIGLLAVAGFYFHHGFERVLEGMHKYYQNPGIYDFHFYMVGEGSEKRKYVQLVKEYGLHQHVEFCGTKTGAALDWYYDNADIGIAPLGAYKAGVISSTPIKTREYCSRGLPFVYGYEDDGFTGKEFYVRKVSNSPEPVDMGEIIGLYETTVENREILKEMRNYSEENFSWDYILNPVIKYLENR
ncbi:MAG: glycosyltransferase [Lachnospiraceae bacterium]|nr:glycosyltransferase [Lachnospiraceae bacterium]